MYNCSVTYIYPGFLIFTLFHKQLQIVLQLHFSSIKEKCISPLLDI